MANILIKWTPAPSATFQRVDHRLKTSSTWISSPSISAIASNYVITGIDSTQDYEIRIVSNCGNILVYSPIIEVEGRDLPCVYNISYDVVQGGSPNTATVTVTSVTGGTAPYTFLWGNGVTGPTVTNIPKNQPISLRITDSNGCIMDTEVTPNNVVLQGLTVEMLYFTYLQDGTVPNEPYPDRKCVGAHVCNRARFDMYGNNVLIGRFSLNNNGGESDLGNIPPGTYSRPDPTDRYSKIDITEQQAQQLVDPVTNKIELTLQFIPVFAGDQPHSTACWLRIKKENGTIVESTCVSTFSSYEFDPYN